MKGSLKICLRTELFVLFDVLGEGVHKTLACCLVPLNFVFIVHAVTSEIKYCLN